MDSELNLKEEQKLWHGSFKSYTIGLLLSLFLSTLSFLFVYYETISPGPIVYTISLFALIQAAVQLRFFLHLGEEGAPYWETFTFLFMLLILLIITLGSLWVMNDLNARMMDHLMPGR